MSQKETGSPLLDIGLFGSVRISVQGEEVTTSLSRRACLVLAILALREGRPIERWRLAGMVWPESPDATALHNLRQTLSPMRNALGPAKNLLKSVSPRSIMLEKANDVSVDAWRFDQALQVASPSSLQEAIDLYRKPLLVECEEPFATTERESRSAAFLNACDQLAAHLLDQRQYSAAIAVLQKALAEDPFREPACRAMMSALAGSGQASAALDVCRGFRNRLRKELNSDISPETRKLVRSIRSVTTEKGSAAHARRLPVSLNRLIGRQNDINQVLSMLGRCRLVTLTGAGGVGKTRLAVAVTAAMNTRLKDGAAFVDLAPLHDATSVIRTIASSLEIPEKASQGIRETVIEEIRNQELLLVLDNCEHLEPQVAETVEDLLCEAPKLLVLATSRQSLGVAGEFVYAVLPLPVPEAARGKGGSEDKDRLRILMESEALRLFIDRSNLHPNSISLDELETAGSICRTLDGLPLAIELAAARTRFLSFREIEVKLANRFALLTNSNRTLPRHRTLEASIAWSWDLLSADERNVLMRISAFRGGCTLATIQAITPDVSEGRLTDIVHSLVDRSLVNATRGALESRFTLLESIRQYSEQKLTESGELNDVFDRHSDYFLEFAVYAETLVGKAEESEILETFEREHDNFRKALNWCKVRNHGEKRLLLANNLGRFWSTQGHVTEGREQIEAAIREVGDDVSELLVAHASVIAGWLATVQKDCDGAVSHYERALSVFRSEGQLVAVGKCLICMGCAFVAGRRFDEAQAAFEASLENVLSRGAMSSVPMLLANLAEVALLRDEDDEARNYLDKAFNGGYGKPQDEYEVFGEAYLHLAIVDYRQSRYEEARKHAAESLRLLHAGKRLVDIPGVLQLIAVTQAPFEDWLGVATLSGAAVALAETYGALLRDTLVEAHADVTLSAKRTLGPAAYDKAYGVGQAMDLNSAVEYALKRRDVSPCGVSTDNSIDAYAEAAILM
jgi:predicted ATPase/DNA-binding SARP family transcriptional activator